MMLRHFLFNGFPLMFTSNARSFPIHLADFALQRLSLFFSLSPLYSLAIPLPDSPSQTLKKELFCSFQLNSDISPSVCYIFSRPKKLTLKGYKQYWCTFKDITISCYKSKEEAHGTPAHQMNLRGANTKKCHFMSTQEF